VLVLHRVSKGTFVNVPLLVDARWPPIFGVLGVAVRRLLLARLSIALVLPFPSEPPVLVDGRILLLRVVGVVWEVSRLVRGDRR